MDLALTVGPTSLILGLIFCFWPGCHAAAQQRTGEISLVEAAQSVITKHPLIRYQQAQVMIDEGLKLQASSAFDTVFNAGLSQARLTSPLTSVAQEQYLLIGESGTDELTNLTQGSFGVSRLFRSGVLLTETLTTTRNVDNLVNPQGVNEVSPNVQLRLPLLRGRGQRAVAAQERAASTEVGASRFDLTNEITSLLALAISDYWNLVAEKKLLSIAVQAEDRARTDLENTQTLVSADRLPRENLNEVNANLAQNAASRIAAEQALIAAQYQFAIDIGMDEQAIANTTLIPTDDLPSPTGSDAPPFTSEVLSNYVQLALSNRSDFIASKMRIEEERNLVVAAKNRLLPQLDVSLNGGYTGLQEGRRFKDNFIATANNVDGPNASAEVTYNFAPRNEAARGVYEQVRASQVQLMSQSAQLAHSISAAVTTAAQAVHNAALETNKARAAVEYYNQSLAGQREKYHLGVASVVDVLTVEDRLTTAMTTAVQAEQAYAQALVQLRAATGTIVAPGKPVSTVGADVFRTIPSPDFSKPLP